MRTGTTLAILMILAVVFPADALADVLPFPIRRNRERTPPPPPSFAIEPFGIQIVDTDQPQSPVLQVSPGFYKQLRKIAFAEPRPNETQLADASRTGSIAAGAALTLAIVTGGLWLARSRGGQRSRLLLLAALTLGTVAGGAATWATPPKAQRPPTPLEAILRVELVDEKSDAVVLRLPRSQIVRLYEQIQRDIKEQEQQKNQPQVPKAPAVITFPK